MPIWLRVGLTQAMSLGAVGLLIGVVAAWVSLLAADGAAAVAGVAATLYLILAAALPLTLLALNWWFAERPPLVEVVAVMLLAAALGFFVAHFSFVVACTNIPAIFGDEDPVAMSRALPAAIGLQRASVVGGATLLAALFLIVRIGLRRP